MERWRNSVNVHRRLLGPTPRARRRARGTFPCLSLSPARRKSESPDPASPPSHTDAQRLGSRPKKNGMNGTKPVGYIIDIQRIDPNEPLAPRRNSAASLVRYGWLLKYLSVGQVLQPARVRARLCQPQPSPETPPCELPCLANSASGRLPRPAGQLFQWQLRQVLAICIAVKRSIGVRHGIGNHFNLADLELGAGSVVLRRFFPAQEVADQRRGGPVGNHARFDHMAEIDKLLSQDGLPR